MYVPVLFHRLPPKENGHPSDSGRERDVETLRSSAVAANLIDSAINQMNSKMCTQFMQLRKKPEM